MANQNSSKRGNLSSNFENHSQIDWFEDAAKAESYGNGGQNQKVHVRIQQRSGRKFLTTVEGLSNPKEILTSCKKKFACNGNIVTYGDGEILQLQGRYLLRWVRKIHYGLNSFEMHW